MAFDAGINYVDFKNLSSKDKFLLLSYKLKEKNKINLASFFFGKLFEISFEIEALLNKIDCLIELGEYDEAMRFNNIGWELFLEDPSVNSFEVEKKLSYQKALIAFYTAKFHFTEIVCEENIIKFKSKEFYHLLLADFVALSNYESAKKFYEKYNNKFGNPNEFLIESAINLLNINFFEKLIDFFRFTFRISEKIKSEIFDFITNHYSFDKNKSDLIVFFEEKVFTNLNSIQSI